MLLSIADYPVTRDDRTGADDEFAGNRLMRQLQNLLAAGRFGPLVLHRRDETPIRVQRRANIRVHPAEGTIVVTTPERLLEILAEDLLAIELQPRGPSGKTHV